MATGPSIASESLDVSAVGTVDVVTITGADPGPTISLLGAVHGDELEGVAAARMLTPMR